MSAHQPPNATQGAPASPQLQPAPPLGGHSYANPSPLSSSSSSPQDPSGDSPSDSKNSPPSLSPRSSRPPSIPASLPFLPSALSASALFAAPRHRPPPLTRLRRFFLQITSAYVTPAIGLSALASDLNAIAFLFPAFPQVLSYIVWFTTLTLFTLWFIAYLTRAILFPPSLRRDVHCNKNVNFLFGPVLVSSNLALTTPPFMYVPAVARTAAYVLLVYQGSFSLYLYGKWLFAPTTDSINFINPLYNMAVIGYFFVARLAAATHQLDAANFAFSVGSLFWIVVFITLFQRVALVLRHQEEAPQPTLFLFMAPPAAATLAWATIAVAVGKNPWDAISNFFFYVALFMYLLMIRLFKVYFTHAFSISWWAYIFPLCSVATATLVFAKSSGAMFWKIVGSAAALVGGIATCIVSGLTVWHFARGNLPKDERTLKMYETWASTADDRDRASKCDDEDVREVAGDNVV